MANSSDIKKSVTTTRFPLGLWSVFFLPYLPIGLVLCLFRICLSLQAVLILLIFPEGRIKRFFLRIFLAVMGVLVTTDGHVSNSKLFISNRVSYIDHIALHLATRCITVSTGGATPPFSSLYPHWAVPFNNSDRILEAAKTLPLFDDSVSVVDYVPYVVQPESLPTNGHHALMEFSEWAFCLNSSIQPLSLSVFRPFPVSVTTIFSSGWFDLMWTLFIPITLFHVKFLPVLEFSEEDTSSDFSVRVQQSLASSLNLVASKITEEDVKKWFAASLSPPPPSPPVITRGPIISPSDFDPSSLQRSASSELESKVHQVTAVLPHVPHNAIRKDLLRTNSVDVTITNLLEGRVQYDEMTPSVKTTSASEIFKRKVTSSSVGQHMSLEERKKELLETARRRYIDKHMGNTEINI